MNCLPIVILSDKVYLRVRECLIFLLYHGLQLDKIQRSLLRACSDTEISVEFKGSFLINKMKLFTGRKPTFDPPGKNVVTRSSGSALNSMQVERKEEFVTQIHTLVLQEGTSCSVIQCWRLTSNTKHKFAGWLSIQFYQSFSFQKTS